MNGVNKMILVGVVVRDPESKVTGNGMAITNLTVVTNYKPKNGEEIPEFHRVVMFARLAEIADQYLNKGSQVYLEGRVQTRSYEKDGIKRYSTEVIAHEMQMLGGKQGSGDKPLERKPSPAIDTLPDDDYPVPF